MAFRYCFESDKVKRTLDKSKRNDLAVVDTEGQITMVCPYFMEKNNELYSMDNQFLLPDCCYFVITTC